MSMTGYVDVMETREKADRPLAAVIVDDDILSCAALARLLTVYCSDVRYLAGITDPETAADFAASGEGDVFFVTTNIPAALMKRITDVLAASPEAVVFVSAVDERSEILERFPRAQFLSTPIGIDELRAVLGKAAVARR